MNYKSTKELCQTFGVTEEWAQSKKKKYIRQEIQELEYQLNWWQIQYGKSRKQDEWFIEDQLDELQNKLTKLQKQLHYLSSPTTKNDIPIEELKKIPIETVLPQGLIKEYSQNNRTKYKCPLHNEKTASFVIYKDTNSFHCFGCGKGGSIIDLVMYLEKIPLAEAIKKLKSLV